MSEMVRCVSCRGAKQVPRLGGIYGDCLTCHATGKMKACDVVRPVVVVASLPMTDALIASTAECVPVEIKDSPVSEVAVEPVAQHDTKARKVYKRKSA